MQAEYWGWGYFKHYMTKKVPKAKISSKDAGENDDSFNSDEEKTIDYDKIRDEVLLDFHK